MAYETGTRQLVSVTVRSPAIARRVGYEFHERHSVLMKGTFEG